MTIFTNRLKTTVPANIVPAAENAGLPSSSLPSLFEAVTSGNFTKVPGITPNIIAAVGNAGKTADAQAFKTVYLASIAFGVLSVCAALCAQNVDEQLTDNVARRLRDTAKLEVSSMED